MASTHTRTLKHTKTCFCVEGEKRFGEQQKNPNVYDDSGDERMKTKKKKKKKEEWPLRTDGNTRTEGGKQRTERTKAASRAVTSAAAHASHAQHRAHAHAYTPQKKVCPQRGVQARRAFGFLFCACQKRGRGETVAGVVISNSQKTRLCSFFGGSVLQGFLSRF